MSSVSYFTNLCEVLGYDGNKHHRNASKMKHTDKWHRGACRWREQCSSWEERVQLEREKERKQKQYRQRGHESWLMWLPAISLLASLCLVVCWQTWGAAACHFAMGLCVNEKRQVWGRKKGGLGS